MLGIPSKTTRRNRRLIRPATTTNRLRQADYFSDKHSIFAERSRRQTDLHGTLERFASYQLYVLLLCMYDTSRAMNNFVNLSEENENEVERFAMKEEIVFCQLSVSSCKEKRRSYYQKEY